MKQVKGSMMKSFIRPARANKSGIYQEILTVSGQKLLKERIFDSVWYPFEVYKEIATHVSKIEGKSDPKVLIKWGQEHGEAILTSIYRGSIVDGDIVKAVDKYARFHRLVFNFGDVKSEFLSDNSVIITYANFEPDFEYFYYIALGWTKRYLELCTSKKVSYIILKKSWEGAEATSYQFSWD
ncbi:MAG: hypothetical protein JW891_10205 [Candidatus Lokiarchaeota archaeon]|nr:hypothetical protein [Candidatus Lokiarchaeota archaeon]